MKRTLGVCYYPEHWPKNLWKEDAKFFECGDPAMEVDEES